MKYSLTMDVYKIDILDVYKILDSLKQLLNTLSAIVQKHEYCSCRSVLCSRFIEIIKQEVEGECPTSSPINKGPNMVVVATNFSKGWFSMGDRPL